MVSQRIFNVLQAQRQGLERRLIQAPAGNFWKRSQTISLEAAHRLIRTSIQSARPFCVGRLGAVEQTIVLWGKGIPKIGAYGIRIPAWYSDTWAGAPNAGIRPRNKESYQAFADLAFGSLKQVDLLAKWNTPFEYALLRNMSSHPAFCEVEDLSPTMSIEGHWVESLQGRKVLVISPFKSSIESQMTRMEQIWEKRGWKWRADFRVVKFPYLIDDDARQTWKEVWTEMLAIVKAGDYDVALMGCGGLGLPLAAAAKSAGRVGIHMGGHLQLLFGIYGQRHLEQDWHARWINDAWVRPQADEVPKTAKRVENGCYW
jgi:hypothetical protein